MKLTGVSKTAILTLRARAEEHGRKDRFFEDPWARDWMTLATWPPELDAWYSPLVQSLLAFRADELDRLLLAWLERAGPGEVTIVELGAGLSSRWHRIGAPRGLGWVDLDLPEVITQREALAPAGDGHSNLACSVLDRRWMDELSGRDPRRTLFLAEGLFYYLERPDVDALFGELRRRFGGAGICFDVLGELDFDRTLRVSRLAGTPLRWMVPPPFNDVWPTFGLEVVPGFEPDQMMRRTIDRYWRRVGRATYWTISTLSRVPSLAAKRSGNVFGTLRPLG